MLKYEEKLHLDKAYDKLQSNNFLHRAVGLVWGLAGYVLLYYLFKYVLTYIQDFQPWNDAKTWLTLGGVRFLKADLVYFACGLLLSGYGSLRLARITGQNHSAKGEKDDTPKKLLVIGYYAKVRHPMYGTFIILQASFLLSLRSFMGILVALVVVIIQYINATIEERKRLVPIFGREYELYRKSVGHKLLTNSEWIAFAAALLCSAIGFAF